MPLSIVLTWVFTIRSVFCLRILLFLFLCFNLSRASCVYDGAIITSQNKPHILLAVSISTSWLNIMIPPNADLLSHSRARLYASFIFFPVASQQELVCLNIATVGIFLLNSWIKCIAASMSTKLLYERAFQFSISNNSHKFQSKLASWWGFSQYLNFIY